MAKNINFCKKSKYSWIIDILPKRRHFCQKINFFFGILQDFCLVMHYPVLRIILQVKNEESTGTVWVCNQCRRKPPNQRRINERFIEPVQGSKPGSSASGRLSSQSNASSNHNQVANEMGAEKSNPVLARVVKISKIEKKTFL